MKRVLLALFAIVDVYSGHMIFRDEIPNSLNVEHTAAVGHMSKTGGGNLNVFGLAFKKAGFTWTKELCMADSDGDGFTNGEELGDPCCTWRSGDPVWRKWGVSHPGDVYRTTTVHAPPNCAELSSSAGQALYAAGGHEFSLYYFQMDSYKVAAKSVSVIAAETALSAQAVKPICLAEQCTVCPHCCGENWDQQIKAMGLSHLHQSAPSEYKWGKKEALEGIADTSQCARCVEEECRPVDDVWQGELGIVNTITWDGYMGLPPAKKEDGTYVKVGSMVNFGGTCTQCSLSNWALQCSCISLNGDMRWSLCGIGLCKGNGVTNNGGILSCSVGINQCLSTYNYAARVATLEKDGPNKLQDAYGNSVVPGAFKTRYQKNLEEKPNRGASKQKLGGPGNSPLLNSVHFFSTGCVTGFFLLFVILERRVLTDVRWLASTRALTLMALSVVYVDVLSGLLHITLDNPTITDWPLLGPECEAFQGHHVAPNDITRGTWLQHLCEAHFVNAILCISYLANRKSATLRQFMIFANIASTWMMAAHRLAHTHPRDMWWWAKGLHSTGLLISPAHHSAHHITYSTNFAIFTGWCNPFINVAVKHFLHQHNPLWVVFFFGAMFAPTALSFGRDRIPMYEGRRRNKTLKPN